MEIKEKDMYLVMGLVVLRWSQTFVIVIRCLNVKDAPVHGLIYVNVSLEKDKC
jgi:hypothetical protein